MATEKTENTEKTAILMIVKGDTSKPAQCATTINLKLDSDNKLYLISNDSEINLSINDEQLTTFTNIFFANKFTTARAFSKLYTRQIEVLREIIANEQSGIYSEIINSTIKTLETIKSSKTPKTLSQTAVKKRQKPNSSDIEIVPEIAANKSSEIPVAGTNGSTEEDSRKEEPVSVTAQSANDSNTEVVPKTTANELSEIPAAGTNGSTEEDSRKEELISVTAQSANDSNTEVVTKTTANELSKIPVAGTNVNSSANYLEKKAVSVTEQPTLESSTQDTTTKVRPPFWNYAKTTFQAMGIMAQRKSPNATAAATTIKSNASANEVQKQQTDEVGENKDKSASRMKSLRRSFNSILPLMATPTKKRSPNLSTDIHITKPAIPENTNAVTGTEQGFTKKEVDCPQLNNIGRLNPIVPIEGALHEADKEPTVVNDVSPGSQAKSHTSRSDAEHKEHKINEFGPETQDNTMQTQLKPLANSYNAITHETNDTSDTSLLVSNHDSSNEASQNIERLSLVANSEIKPIESGDLVKPTENASEEEQSPKRKQASFIMEKIEQGTNEQDLAVASSSGIPQDTKVNEFTLPSEVLEFQSGEHPTVTDNESNEASQNIEKLSLEEDSKIEPEAHQPTENASASAAKEEQSPTILNTSETNLTPTDRGDDTSATFLSVSNHNSSNKETPKIKKVSFMEKIEPDANEQGLANASSSGIPQETNVNEFTLSPKVLEFQSGEYPTVTDNESNGSSRNIERLSVEVDSKTVPIESGAQVLPTVNAPHPAHNIRLGKEPLTTSPHIKKKFHELTFMERRPLLASATIAVTLGVIAATAVAALMAFGVIHHAPVFDMIVNFLASIKYQQIHISPALATNIVGGAGAGVSALTTIGFGCTMFNSKANTMGAGCSSLSCGM